MAGKHEGTHPDMSKVSWVLRVRLPAFNFWPSGDAPIESLARSCDAVRSDTWAFDQGN